MRSYRIGGFFCRALILATFMAAFVFNMSARAEVVDRIVAVVNDDIITLSELDIATKVALGGLKSDDLEELLADTDKDKVDTVSLILDAMIEKTLMKQSAERVGIEVSEQEIDNAIEDVIADNNIDRDVLMRYLEKNDLTYKEYREQIKEDIREVKFTDRYFRARVVMKEETLREMYNRSRDDFKGSPSYRLKLIVLTPKEGEVSVDEPRVAMVEEALSGADFDSVVMEYSDGPAKDKGGDIGYVESADLDPLISEAVSKLSAGGVSPLLEVGEAVYFVKLVDTQAGDMATFEEASNTLKQILYKRLLKERYDEWLDNTRRFSHVEVRL